jgi:hypothetical protein
MVGSSAGLCIANAALPANSIMAKIFFVIRLSPPWIYRLQFQ